MSAADCSSSHVANYQTVASPSGIFVQYAAIDDIPKQNPQVPPDINTLIQSEAGLSTDCMCADQSCSVTIE
jgi:hypothetical protein